MRYATSRTLELDKCNSGPVTELNTSEITYRMYTLINAADSGWKRNLLLLAAVRG